MKRFRLLALGACLGLIANGVAQAHASTDTSALETGGRFKEAAATLAKALEDRSLSSAERQRLRFELDRLERIKKDFPFTRETLFAELRKSVRNLDAEEYDRWVKEDRFDSREIDGQRRFMVSSVSNLYFRYPELEGRRLKPKDRLSLDNARWESCLAIKKAARLAGKSYVLPKRFHVTMTVTAKPGAAPAGEIIRAWVPVPRRYPFQEGFEVVSASPPLKQLDDEQSPIRSAYFEQAAAAGQPTRFKIDYTYTTHGVWFDIKPGAVRPCNAEDPGLKPFLQEGPHVVFTPEIRALSAKVVGQATNPYIKARKCYDWIAENIKYSYAIEYSTIRNISDYCRRRGYGDCGQEALLFMTLCRLNGIPARWQSGWNTFPGAKSNHDWSEIYLEPYGWVPVDPYMGIFAMRYATTLQPEQRQEIRDFYFGGLDQYRMIANSDHSQALRPPKRTMRSDDVDFQRGELEYGDQNIYLDNFSYDLSLKEVTPASGKLD